jgi:predicted transcriptional regulator
VGPLLLAPSLEFPYSILMTIELPATVERELRDLAITQSRDVGEIVEEAVRQYLEASAITDLDASEIAETQTMLIGASAPEATRRL